MLSYDFSVEHIETLSKLPDRITADFVVLPIPTLNKRGFVNIEGNDFITAQSLMEVIDKNATIISCNYYSPNYKTIDINNRDDFAYLNAIPTAEGAINIAISGCDYSLFDEEILITGFGRVAKILADRLKGLTNKVTIAARSLKDISYAKALGLKTIRIANLKENINKYSVIFQTVPVCIIDKEIIDSISVPITIIELSSKSSGTDYTYAASKGVNVVHAPGLPEKVAPLTAGNILTESVLSIIEENH